LNAVPFGDGVGAALDDEPAPAADVGVLDDFELEPQAAKATEASSAPATPSTLMRLLMGGVLLSGASAAPASVCCVSPLPADG
jgi:hypothetical protein